MDELVFLKLGGSLITEKTLRYSARFDKLAALAAEIHDALAELPELRVVLGHGSGSFGHFAVQEHLIAAPRPLSKTGRKGADAEYWKGFAEVWYQAAQLNRHVVEALHQAAVPVVSLAPSAGAITSNGKIVSWDLAPLQAALNAGVIPLIFGDIVFDDAEGGKVLSTEVLMWHLARELRRRRILLAGLEAAVWADFPARLRSIGKITPRTSSMVADQIGGSQGPDVTGGMKSKVEEMLALVQTVPGLSVRIFSGEEGGNVRRALAGEALGTLIISD